MFDTEEIVVKPVAPILRYITTFSGNTILGDGSVIMILDTKRIARATGIGESGESKARTAGAAGSGSEAARSGEKTAMLLFRAAGNSLMAVSLGLIARHEDIPREKIESSCGQPVTQYRGKPEAAGVARRAVRSGPDNTSPYWCSPIANAPCA